MDDSRVVLEDGGGVQFVATSDDLVADLLKLPGAIGEGDHLRVV